MGLGQRDIAVRMTLGAEATHIVREVVVCGVRIGLVGTGCGLLQAAGLVRLVRSQLYGVSHAAYAGSQERRWSWWR